MIAQGSLKPWVAGLTPARSTIFNASISQLEDQPLLPAISRGSSEWKYHFYWMNALRWWRDAIPSPAVTLRTLTHRVVVWRISSIERHTFRISRPVCLPSWEETLVQIQQGQSWLSMLRLASGGVHIAQSDRNFRIVGRNGRECHLWVRVPLWR